VLVWVAVLVVVVGTAKRAVLVFRGRVSMGGAVLIKRAVAVAVLGRLVRMALVTKMQGMVETEYLLQ
jgi:hypothetical protein